MSNALSIPIREMPEFGCLQDKDRSEILTWLDVLAEFQQADNKRAAAQELRARYGSMVRISLGTIYRKLKAFEQDGWRGLRNGNRDRRRKQEQNVVIPQAFIDFWQVLCEENQRKCAPAYRKLFFDHLIPGRMIPGYGTWQQIWRTEHQGFRVPDECPYRPYDNTPSGWSYRNLMRYAPESYQLTAARIGTGAASEFLPKVPTTRVGLKLGQFWVIDDVYHDQRVNFVDNRHAQIPLELGALELLSWHYAVWGVKPVRERLDGTREHLKEVYVRYLLAHICCRVGICADGCTFLGEHGTATVPKDLLEAMNRWSGGRIAFEAGGIQGKPIAKGLYDGRPRGNFRFKASLESHHNLKHNELAALPGQKGMDRGHAPEDLYGRDKLNNALTKAVIALADERPDLAGQLMRPFMPYNLFVEALSIIYDRIADRKHHALEGFEEAGLTVSEFKLFDGAPWMPLEELDRMKPEERAAVQTLIKADRRRQNVRRMSPLEAFASRRSDLVRLPDCAVPDILGRDLAQEVTVSPDKTLYVKDLEIPNKTYAFVAVATTAKRREIDMRRRERFLVHVSPFDPSEAYVSTLKGEYIGVAQAMQRVCRADIEGLQRDLGLLQHAQNLELQKLMPLAERKLRRQREAATANVTALAGENPVHALQERRERAKQYDDDYRDLAALPAGSGQDEDDGYGVSMDELREL